MAGGSGRVKKELEECERSAEVSGVNASMKNSSLNELIGYINGPEGTPYEGGKFILEIRIPQKYPFEPPKIKFETKIWHPNISSQTGAICLDILKDQWSPALTIKTALLSIQALLSAAEPDDPQDAEVARMFVDDHEVFLRTAQFWTESYAKQTQNTQNDKIQRLVDMGFGEETARKALEKSKGDENAAVEALLSAM